MLHLDPIPNNSLIQIDQNMHDDALTSKLMEKINENVDSATRTVQDDEETERIEREKDKKE
jgi:hypothetical protein